MRTAVLLVTLLTTGAYLPSPLYPDYQRLFGYDDLVMTLLFATFALVSCPALLLFGPAADLVGSRPMLRLSVLLGAAGSCCFLVADGPAWLFAGRVCQALALGAVTGAAQAVITRYQYPSGRFAGPILATLAFAVGTAAGPAASGVLAQYAPGPLVTPYLLHLVLLGWTYVQLNRTVPEAGAAVGARRWRPVRPHIPPGIRTIFFVAGLNGFLAWAVVGLYLALVPALLERALNSDDPALAGGVLAAVLVWSLPAQIVGARRAPRTTQLLGVGGLTASLLLLAATEAASLHATLASALLAGVGHGLAFSGAVRAVDARIPAGHHAGTGAALYLLFYLGSGTPRHRRRADDHLDAAHRGGGHAQLGRCHPGRPRAAGDAPPAAAEGRRERGRHGRRRTELAAGEPRGRARLVKGNSAVVGAAESSVPCWTKLWNGATTSPPPGPSKSTAGDSSTECWAACTRPRDSASHGGQQSTFSPAALAQGQHLGDRPGRRPPYVRLLPDGRALVHLPLPSGRLSVL